MTEGNIPPVEGPQASQEQASSSLPRVLIFEDDPDVAKLMRIVLSGCEITGLHERAEDVLKKKEEGEGYEVPQNIDVVITDHGLKGMNGIEATKIIIDAYKEAGKVPPHFIMVTGRGNSPQVQEEAKAAGISEVFGKPFSPRALIASVEKGNERVQELRNSKK